jgi:hypothetical protein
MNTDVSNNPDATAMSESAADAWAAVYIDVAEKLDAEEQQQSSEATTGKDASPVA